MKSIKQTLIGLTLASLLAITGTGFSQASAPIQDSFAGITLTATPVHAEPMLMNFEDVSALRKLSDVQLAAFINVLDATPQLPCAALPRNGMLGNYFSLQHPEWPPLPMNSSQSSVWQMDGFYLMNDVNFDYDAASAVSLAAGPRMRMGAMLDDDGGLNPPGAGGDDYGDDTNSYDFYTFNTNLLYLEITNVSGGLAYANLHHATNQIYSIWSTTNLLAAWQVEIELWPMLNQTNVLPFTVRTLNRDTLFLRAEDWTGVYANGLPCWWTWYWYGNLNESATSLDAPGINTLGDDYTNGIDPNVITFAIEVTNDYVHSSPVPVQVAMLVGAPSQVAVVVDDTNYVADAVWGNYSSSNLTVNLGGTAGWHEVWIGLRGSMALAPVWQEVQLDLDITPPLVVLTNPLAATVFTPLIQIQGYANETLSSFTYDVSNVTGTFPDQTGYLTGSYYDTNLLIFTTNYFQCYDVALAEGLNTVTVHATDLGGNATATSFNVTLDYSSDTTAPTLSIIWPPTGTYISGSQFTLQGQVDDNTATVSAVIVDASGDTNTISGLVERSGQVWVAGLPLSSGTNTVYLTASDAAGNTTVTSLSVMKSDFSLTLDPLTDDQLNLPTVDVTGSVSQPGDSVTVNDVSASVAGNGECEADGVPVSASGTASLQVTARNGSGQVVAEQTFNQDQPPKVGLLSYMQDDIVPNIAEEHTRWDYLAGGNYWSDSIYTGDDEEDLPPGDAGNPALFSLPGVNFHWENNSVIGVTGNTTKTQTHIRIEPGGKAATGTMKSYIIQSSASGEDFSGFGSHWPLDPASLQIRGVTLIDITNSDGSVWGETMVTAPAGTSVDITPQTHNVPNYHFDDGDTILRKTKEDWQAQVQQEIDADSSVAIENYKAENRFLNNRKNIQAVYAFYQKLFTNNPTTFYWAGLAKLAGAPVYAGLSDAQNLKFTGFILGGGTPALAIALGEFGETYGTTFQYDLISMNIAVMNDLAWQFEAYKAEGLDALKVIDAVDATHTIVDLIAWQEIDDGIQNGDDEEIQEGNQRLLQREQNTILQPGYVQLSDLPGAVTLMTEFAENPVDDIAALSFSSLEPDGSIAVFSDRWDWITRPYVNVSDTGIWPLWLQFSQPTQLSLVAIPLKTRAADYSLAAQYSFLYLPIQ